MKFNGLAANPGTVSAPVCIVHDANEFTHCSTENIALLVGIKPTAALTSQVKGILAVHGGITSHAAIAARENNKPAVVGLSPGILEHLKDGDWVTMNGETGEIELN